MSKKQEGPQRIAVKSLADLGAVTFTVEVEDVDEAVLEFRMKVPSSRRWSEIVAMVTWPKAPIGGVDPVTKRPMLDETDATYIRNTNETASVVNFMLLADALQMDIPGDTLAEKADALRDTLNAQVATKLINKLLSRGKTPEASVLARAATFQPNGATSPSDTPA